MFTFSKFLILSAFFMSLQAKADYLNCDLTLNPIDGTSSSEIKQLYFTVQMEDSKQLMSGSLNTISCFGTIFQSFKSDTVRVNRYMEDGLLKGSVNDAKVQIANHLYRFQIKFAQAPASFNNPIPTDLKVGGKVLSLDDDYFIHRIPTGVCHITEQPVSLIHYYSSTNNKWRSLCH